MNKIRTFLENIVHVTNIKNTKNRILFLFIGITILVCSDLFIKYYVESTFVRPLEIGMELAENEHTELLPNRNHTERKRYVLKEVTVIKNFWDFIYVRNYNVGFSFLSFLDNMVSQSTKAVGLSIMQIGVSILAIFFLKSIQFNYLLPGMMIISGGLGNGIDRVMRGYVVDYVKWYIPGSNIPLTNPWPIFNLADSLVVIAVFLIILTYDAAIFDDKKSKKK